MRSILLYLALFSCGAWAQATTAPDAKGCVESKVVSRMPGCFIVRCDSKDFSAAEMPRTRAEKGNMVEGELATTVYRCPAGKSPLELGRNTEAALKNAGFNILYTDVYTGGARFWMTAQRGIQWVKLFVVSDAYELTTVKQKQLEPIMTANADGWAQQINQSGRVSVYGINSTQVNPRSAPTLSPR